MDVIDSFRGEHWFLSNFSPSRITVLGLVFPTVEHAYQAMKASDLSDVCLIARAPSPAAAKRMGGQILLREDWDEVKLDVMDFCLRLKFRHPNLKARLMATGDSRLVEDNTWGEVYWGVCDGKGHNYLGLLLMRLRTEFSDDDHA